MIAVLILEGGSSISRWALPENSACTYRGIARVRIEVLREIPILEKPNLRNKMPSQKPPSSPFAALFTERR